MDAKVVGLATDEERQEELTNFLKHAPYLTHESKVEMLRQGGKSFLSYFLMTVIELGFGGLLQSTSSWS